MGDTWNDLVELKSKKLSMREKLARRKKEREDIIGETLGEAEDKKPDLGALEQSTSSLSPAPATEVKQEAKIEKVKLEPELLKEIEEQLLLTIDDATIELPIGSNQLLLIVMKNTPMKDITLDVVNDLVQKFAAINLLKYTEKTDKVGKSTLIIESINHAKVTALTTAIDDKTSTNERKRKADSKEDEGHDKVMAKHPKREDLQKKDDLIESLLSTKSAKQLETTKINEEIMELLSTPSTKELSLVEKFRSQGGTSLKEFCPHGTKQECSRIEGKKPCGRLHFKKIIHKHTDESLGDCSFLNTCFHMDTCKYVHYEVDYPEDSLERSLGDRSIVKSASSSGSATTLYPPQWVQCDLRYFDMRVLGKFSVIMADPPWDIHMELPYGTMSDDEMRKLGVPILQDNGYIFLWVTGRAMELGRECLKLWGYERVDELIWVKTNQLQRIIRTGRTGHWFNHGKEHCLVGVKGNPQGVNRGLDCDIIVAEVRATSHKPDEVYGMIERLSPGTRKIELFGRPHNVQPNWITLGNQTDGVKLVDPEVAKAFNAKYPNPKMALLSEEKGLQYLRTGTID